MPNRRKYKESGHNPQHRLTPGCCDPYADAMSMRRKRDREHSRELVKAGELPFVAELAQDIEECITESEIIRPEDIAYTHSIFLQCFLPLRHRPSNVRRWETGNRLAKLVIRAGELVDPDSPGTFKECAVPAA
jgi:hypothetical protein